MNIKADCISCMIDQVKKALTLLKPDITNDEIVEAQKKIMTKFGQLNKKSAPYHGQLIYSNIAKIIGKKDPYRELKHKYNNLAADLAPKLKKILDKSENPLLDAINIAILGNCVDFGTPHALDLEKEVEEYSLSHLKINHFKDLKEDLEKDTNKNIIIVGDNTGEIVFDKIMLEYLISAYPEKNFIYAVRGGPAINDATITDAKNVGITELCKVVEGSKSPGVIMDEVSDEFKEAFSEADIILSKGQGNFESLDNIPANGEVYFLLKTKCEPVAEMFGVPLGSLVLYHRDSTADFAPE